MENLPFTDENNEKICYCFGVDSFTIKKAIYLDKLKTVEEVTAKTKAGGGCMSCHMRIEELLDEVWAIIEKEQNIKRD